MWTWTPAPTSCYQRSQVWRCVYPPSWAFDQGERPIDRQPIPWAEVLSLFGCDVVEIKSLSISDAQEHLDLMELLIMHPQHGSTELPTA